MLKNRRPTGHAEPLFIALAVFVWKVDATKKKSKHFSDTSGSHDALYDCWMYESCLWKVGEARAL